MGGNRDGAIMSEFKGITADVIEDLLYAIGVSNHDRITEIYRYWLQQGLRKSCLMLVGLDRHELEYFDYPGLRTRSDRWCAMHFH